jgi:hypothetical protein
VEVAVLALPRDRSIDLDVPEIIGQQFRGLGGDLSSVSGATVAVQIKVPGTDVDAVLQQGFEISIAVQTLFLGEPVAARYMILVLERPASPGGAVPGGTSPTAGAGASSPLPPPSVPPATSANPPAAPSPPPSATPPVTPP